MTVISTEMKWLLQPHLHVNLEVGLDCTTCLEISLRRAAYIHWFSDNILVGCWNLAWVVCSAESGQGGNDLTQYRLMSLPDLFGNYGCCQWYVSLRIRLRGNKETRKFFFSKDTGHRKQSTMVEEALNPWLYLSPDSMCDTWHTHAMFVLLHWCLIFSSVWWALSASHITRNSWCVFSLSSWWSKWPTMHGLKKKLLHPTAKTVGICQTYLTHMIYHAYVLHVKLLNLLGTQLSR